MDYLDPKQQFRHRIILFTGYVLIAIAILMAATILKNIAYGYAIGSNGAVIQNGWMFFSSHPKAANIYVDGKLQAVSTNTRLVLPSDIYHVRLVRDGYRDWQRTIELEGGSVEHFDYPMLFPKKLVTKTIHPYAAAPGLVTQSPDRRWLLVEQPGSMTGFDIYDLKNPAKAAVASAIPADLLTKSASNESWQLGEWADDNQHVLLQHIYDGKTEYVLLDRTQPDQSINLTKSIPVNSSKLTLRNKKYDQYYVYDSATASLQTASLKTKAPVPLLEHVLTYQSYGSDSLLYVTDSNTPAGSVAVKLRIGDKTYDIRNLPTSTTYLVDLTKYSGTMYVAAGAANGSKVYIFKDPVGQVAKSGHAVAPIQVLHVPQPNYLSFSTNAQFIAAANGNRFGVYDIENDQGYNYTTDLALDAPQAHASWMDGDRLALVSGGKLTVFDYDNTNQQTLMSASAAYLPAFAPNFKDAFSLNQNATTGQFELTQTSLLIPADR